MTDKKTIGLTPAGEMSMQQVMDKGCFNNMIDAAKFAMSVAIRAGMPISSIEGASTIWNVGSFDSDGQVRQVLSVLMSDCDSPYRTAESLIDQGLQLLHADIQSGHFDPLTIVNATQS